MHKFFGSIALAVSLAGCSVWGGKSFQCPGNEMDGATCMSARQVYEATHVTDRVAPNYRDGKPIAPGEQSASSSGSAPTSAAPQQALLNTYLPPLPEADAPLPVRTPAKVMRIRVFPWEDKERDLNTGGFVFTEIEGRTWTLGEDQVSRVQANVISPLAMPKGVAPIGQFGAPLATPAQLTRARQSDSQPLPAPAVRGGSGGSAPSMPPSAGSLPRTQ